MEDWKFVNEYKHTCGIIRVYPHPLGNLIFIDDKYDGFIYNPVSNFFVFAFLIILIYCKMKELHF